MNTITEKMLLKNFTARSCLLLDRERDSCVRTPTLLEARSASKPVSPQHSRHNSEKNDNRQNSATSPYYSVANANPPEQ